jgi:phosphoribosylformylglycinamidine synthase
MIGSLNICSRKPLTEQYDTDVGLVKVIGPGGDGGLARVPGTQKGIAVSTDCNSRYTYLDPYNGTMFAVVESARNVLVTGAKPIGITNNLNFANPYIPENYYMFSECIRGMGDACRFLGLPVTGGNVSFYNESPQGPVYPTPTIGMVGLISNIENHVKPFFQDQDEAIYLIGKFQPTLGGSEFLQEIHNKVEGPIPTFSLQDELNLQKAFLEINEFRLIHSAKDLSLGGLAIAILKMALGFQIGVELTTQNLGVSRLDELLFGESACSILVSANSKNEKQISTILSTYNLNCIPVGRTNSTGQFSWKEGNSKLNLQELKTIYESGIQKYFE